MFFLVPDDLTGLDIANGQCYNASVPQNVTFGYQGLPLGLGSGNVKKSGASSGLVVGPWREGGLLFMLWVVMVFGGVWWTSV